MNDTLVPYNDSSPHTEPILGRLVANLNEMSPQLRKAARFVLDNPNEIGLSSIREIAEAADVKPNTLVRMARAVGFEGYEDFRLPFREELRAGRETFPDRARWLQSIAKGGRFGRLLSDMAETTLENVEQLYADTDAGAMKSAADRIVSSRATFVLGVGICHALTSSFAYLARMAIDNVTAIPRDSAPPIDDIAKAWPEDVLLAMTFEPYRVEVIEAVDAAREKGLSIIAVTDSRASPIAIGADHVFVAPTRTPQFFNSTVGATALLETLMAFVVAEAGDDAVANIECIDRLRRQSGIYL